MSEPKQRMLVMNGQKLIQQQLDGAWQTEKVSKAGLLKPGIYDIHLSQTADAAKVYDGLVLHADQNFVYQKVGKDYIKHDRQSFDKLPEAGTTLKISYSGGKALSVASSGKLSRGITR